MRLSISLPDLMQGRRPPPGISRMALKAWASPNPDALCELLGGNANSASPDVAQTDVTLNGVAEEGAIDSKLIAGLRI